MDEPLFDCDIIAQQQRYLDEAKAANTPPGDEPEVLTRVPHAAAFVGVNRRVKE